MPAPHSGGRDLMSRGTEPAPSRGTIVSALGVYAERPAFPRGDTIDRAELDPEELCVDSRLEAEDRVGVAHFTERILRLKDKRPLRPRVGSWDVIQATRRGKGPTGAASHDGDRENE